MVIERYGSRALLFAAFCLMSSCLGMHTDHIVISAPSLTVHDEFELNKVYQRSSVARIVLSGIEIDAFLYNAVLAQHYDQNLIIPIPTMREPRESSSVRAMGESPFIIVLGFRASNNHTTFYPFSSQLYTEGKNKPVVPEKITSRERKFAVSRPVLYPCLYEYSKRFDNWSVSTGPLTIPKQMIHKTPTNSNFEERWLCVKMYFDTPTPNPFEKFQLKLGEIVMPDGKRIRPIIYFSPVVIRDRG